MNTHTRKLHDLGQSLRLDNSSRELLVAGLTSNPTVFERGIGNGDSYDKAIGDLAGRALTREDLLFALDDCWPTMPSRPPQRRRCISWQ